MPAQIALLKTIKLVAATTSPSVARETKLQWEDLLRDLEREQQHIAETITAIRSILGVPNAHEKSN